MAPVLRYAVLGEGRDEHGLSANGPDYRTLSAPALQGCLVVLVARLLTERFGQSCEALRWLPVDRSQVGRRGPPPSPREILCSENLLARFLNKVLFPIQREPPTLARADFVVLASDEQIATSVTRAVGRLTGTLRGRVVPVFFTPEMEVLFIQAKQPLEAVMGLAQCTSQPPATRDDPKECLRGWLHEYGAGRLLDARMLEDTACHLDLGSNSYLNGVEGWRQLVEGLQTFVNTTGR